MISVIAATDHNRVIGQDGELPWHLPEDLQHFRLHTLEKPIIMGRRTYESIGKPLDRRTNIVLTNQQNFQVEGCQVVHSIEAALSICRDSEEIMVIGGESVFETFLPRIDRIYLTIIHQSFEGDTYFPQLKSNEWYLSNYQEPTEDPSVAFSYFILDRETTEPLNWKTLDRSRLPDFLQEGLREPEPTRQ